MSSSINQLIDNIYYTADYILNIIPAYREQIISKVYKTHSDGICTKEKCYVQEYLSRHLQNIQKLAQQLDKDFTYFERLSCDNPPRFRNGYYQQREKYPRRNFNNNFTKPNEPEIDSKLTPINSNELKPSTQVKTEALVTDEQPCTSKQANQTLVNDKTNELLGSVFAADYKSNDEYEDHMLFNQGIYLFRKENPIAVDQNFKTEKSESSFDFNNNHLPQLAPLTPITPVSVVNDLNSPIQTVKIVNSSMHEEKSFTFDLNTTIKNDKTCKNNELNQSKIEPDTLNNTICHTSLSGAEKLSSGLVSYQVAQILKYDVYIRGRNYDCWITHVQSPFLIWTQQKSSEKKVTELHSKLQKYYNNPDKRDQYIIKPDKLRKDLYVAATFSDNRWYRAKVIRIDEHKTKATVFYLDYGNCEEIEIDKMRLLIEKFLKSYPVYATPISIAHICPNDLNDWSDSVVKKMKDFLNNREASFVAIRDPDWPIWLCGNFEITANKKQYSVIDYMKSRKIGRAQPLQYITKNYRKYIDVYDNTFKFIRYVEISENEAVNLKEAKEVKEIGLSLIKEVNEANESNKQQCTSELSYLKEEPIEKLKEININSLEENLVSHEGKHFITNFEKSFKLKDLKRKMFELDRNAEFKFKIRTIKNPFRFYVTLVDDNHDEYIDMLQELNEYYNKNENYLVDLAKQLKYNFVIENLLCVAKSKSNIFYRAYVKDFIDFDDEFYGYEETSKEQKISVCCLENGQTEELNRTDLFPIAKEFCEKEPHSFCCSLDRIEPIDYSDISLLNQDFIWSKDAIDLFKAVVQEEKIYSAQSLDYTHPYNKITSDFENPLKVLIINDKAEKYEDLKYINEVLVSQYHLAKFCLKSKNDEDNLSETPSRCAVNAAPTSSTTTKAHLPNLPSEEVQERLKKERIERFLEDCIQVEAEEKKKRLKEEKEKELKSIQDKFRSQTKEAKKIEKIEDPLEKWNPNKEHFESIRNAYFFNEQSYEAHHFGYETKYQGSICRAYLESGDCRRKNCPFIHQIPNDELVFTTKTREKQQIILDIDYNTFEIGDILYLSGVSYTSPNIINACVLGHYNNNLRTCVSINNYTEITSLMNKYYGKKKFAQEKTTLYSIGQVVAAKSRITNNWLRGKITKIFTDDNIDNEAFEVFYVDLGYSEILNIKDLYPLKKAFSTYPIQSVQLEIFNTKIVKVDKFREYIQEASNKTDYLYAIVNNVGETLEVFLYGYYNDEVFCINEEIVKREYGYEIEKVSQSSFHYMKII